MGIEEFQLLKVLGKGSFGIVYKAVRRTDGNAYAIKEVDITSMSTREREDAVNEIRLLSAVRHPNIIGYHEAFFEDDSAKLYIVMEYATKGDLLRLIERHRRNCTHVEEDILWDLKSANIFLMSDLHLKIGDLGVAKLMKSRHQLASTQVGTPYYISPEIWMCKPYNDKSDIWALGCLIYELAALQYPFSGRDARQLKMKIQRGAQVRDLPSQYSSALNNVVRRMLSHSSFQRPSAAEILQMPCAARGVAMLQYKLGAVIEGEHGSPISARHFVRANLATIRLPRNFQPETAQAMLPKPCYSKELLVLPSIELQVSLEPRAREAKPSQIFLSPIRFPALRHGANKPQRGRGLQGAVEDCSRVHVNFGPLRQAREPVKAYHLPFRRANAFLGKENVPNGGKEPAKPLGQIRPVPPVVPSFSPMHPRPFDPAIGQERVRNFRVRQLIRENRDNPVPRFEPPRLPHPPIKRDYGRPRILQPVGRRQRARGAHLGWQFPR